MVEEVLQEIIIYELSWLSGRHFLQCFDTVGWVILTYKTRPWHDLYYNMFSGTLNPAQSIHVIYTSNDLNCYLQGEGLLKVTCNDKGWKWLKLSIILLSWLLATTDKRWYVACQIAPSFPNDLEWPVGLVAYFKLVPVRFIVELCLCDLLVTIAHVLQFADCRYKSKLI